MTEEETFLPVAAHSLPDSVKRELRQQVATSLVTNGYMVMVIPDHLQAQFTLVEFQQNACNTYQGFTEHAKTLRCFSAGSFGGHNHAGGFLNPFNRQRTVATHSLLKEICVAYLETAEEQGLLSEDDDLPKYHFYQSLGRLVSRYPGKEWGAAESWHRDTTPHHAPHKHLILGGWFNIGDTTSSFSCAPGTHLFLKPDNPYQVQGKGFDKIPKECRAELNNAKVDVQVPAKHFIVFVQDLAHMVKKSDKLTKHEDRAHISCFATTFRKDFQELCQSSKSRRQRQDNDTSDLSLRHTVKSRTTTPLLKSGQNTNQTIIPRSYSNFSKYFPLATRFCQQHLEPNYSTLHSVQNPKSRYRGTQYRIPHTARLDQTGLGYLPPSNEELQVYTPTPMF